MNEFKFNKYNKHLSSHINLWTTQQKSPHMLHVEKHKNFKKITNSWVLDKPILKDLEHMGTERNYSLINIIHL
jgi:hypothetical protein